MRIISVRDLPKNELDFYLDTTGNVKYNPVCESCPHECKQSFRAELLACGINVKVKTKTEYLDEIKKQKRNLKDVAHSTNIHLRTLRSLLNNDSRDIDFETHFKLMMELYNVDINQPTKKKKRRK